jgi:hypothetical protein
MTVLPGEAIRIRTSLSGSLPSGKWSRGAAADLVGNTPLQRTLDLPTIRTISVTVHLIYAISVTVHLILGRVKCTVTEIYLIYGKKLNALSPKYDGG